MNPYTETLQDNISYRTFSEDTSEEEFVWHRDREDRLVEVLEQTDWKIQMENELPMTLSKVFIPKGSYHRVIKGTGSLKIKITKY